METATRVQTILEEAHKELDTGLPWDLIEDILNLENDAQFAEQRGATVTKIAERVRSAVAREELAAEQ
jgi:hypothetical protein